MHRTPEPIAPRWALVGHGWNVDALREPVTRRLSDVIPDLIPDVMGRYETFRFVESPPLDRSPSPVVRVYGQALSLTGSTPTARRSGRRLTTSGRTSRSSSAR